MKYFVSLGTGNHQIPFLIALKNLNYKIIGIDQNPDSPGRDYCDIFWENSITDYKEISQYLKKNKYDIQGIYSRSYGEAVRVANQIAKDWNLIHNPVESLEIYKNKKNILEIAVQHSYLEKQKKMMENIKEASHWIIKKNNSYGKKEIFLEKEFKNLKEFINSNEYIVEPFYYYEPETFEYIFFGFIVNKQLFPLIITQKEILYNENLTIEPLSFCDKRHYFPSQLSLIQKYKIFQIANYIVKKTKLVWGPFFCEFIVNQHDIFFIEAAPEVGGEFISDDLIPYVLNLPYFEYLAKIYSYQDLEIIRESLNRILLIKKEKNIIINYIFQDEGIFVDLIFPHELYQSSEFYFARILKNSRTPTSLENKNTDRIGVFSLAGLDPISKLKSLSHNIEKKVVKKYLNTQDFY